MFPSCQRVAHLDRECVAASREVHIQLLGPLDGGQGPLLCYSSIFTVAPKAIEGVDEPFVVRVALVLAGPQYLGKLIHAFPGTSSPLSRGETRGANQMRMAVGAPLREQRPEVGHSARGQPL